MHFKLQHNYLIFKLIFPGLSSDLPTGGRIKFANPGEILHILGY